MQQKIPKINNFELFFPKSDPDNYDQFIEPLRFFYFCYNGKAIYIKVLREKNSPYAVCCNFQWSDINLPYMTTAKVLYKSGNLTECINKFKFYVKKLISN